MRNYIKLITYKVLTLLLFSVSVSVQSQITVPPQEIIGASLQEGQSYSGVIDPELGSILSSVSLNARTYVRLNIVENQPPFDVFKYKIKLKVQHTYANGSSTQTIRDLEIENNQLYDGNVVDLSQLLLVDSYGVSVIVEEILVEYTDAGTTSNITPDNVKLTLGFEVDRYYELASNAPTAVVNISTYNNDDGSAKQEALNLQWSSVYGAREYELEWTWVDNYGPNNTSLAAAAIGLTEREFQLNSTRVSLSGLNYEIPLVYSRGYVIYRVRAVGRFLQDTTKKFFGPWSSASNLKQHVGNWPHIIVTNDHESGKNWEFESNYAEEGKKKEVVTYFDGTLRSRQTVTTVNSDNNTIAGEVIYDVQGRPAIEVLPTPVTRPNIDKGLRYYRDLNVNVNELVYNHIDFDWSILGSCDIQAEGMADTSGASKYYSGNNEQQGNFQDYVPDAKKYPFSQIEYTPDNTGRVARKSGVGSEHVLGSNSELKYFYSVPTQEELNRLFGNGNVGNVQHYKKQIIVDPNGQVSVNYVDPQGKTIATALAGDNPIDANANPTFIPLEDEANASLHNFVTTDLLNKVTLNATDTDVDNNILYSTGSISNYFDGLLHDSQRVVVSDGAINTLDYKMSSSKLFESDSICERYPLVYKLNVDITDDCGASVLTDAQRITDLQIGEYAVNSDTGELNFDSTSGALTYDMPSILKELNIGAYGIKKDIIVDKNALQVFANDYVLKLTDSITPNNICYIDWADFAPQTNLAGCYESCDECVENQGTEQQYVENRLGSGLNGGGSYDVNSYTALEWTLLEARFRREHELLIEACMAPCGLDGTNVGGSDNTTESVLVSNALDLLVGDMRPIGGQYGISYDAEDTNGNPVNIDQSTSPAFIYNVYDTVNNQLFSPIPSLTNYDWRHPSHYLYDSDFGSGHYYTATGEIVRVTVILDLDNPGQFIPAVNVTPTQDIATGQYSVEPHQLTNVIDFANIYQNSWGESLVKYHPEYFYLKYVLDLADETMSTPFTVTVDVNGIPDTSSSIELNSDGFNNLLESAVDYNGAEDMNLLLNACALVDNDPFFQQSLEEEQGVTVTLSGLSVTLQQLRKSIMEEALGCNGAIAANGGYEGSGKTILQTAYAGVTCNSVEECDAVDSSIPSPSNTTILGYMSITNPTNPNYFSDNQKNRFWAAYRGYYLSLKQKIFFSFINAYAKTKGAYNGCVDEEYGSIDVTAVLSNYPQHRAAINQYIASSNPSQTVCNQMGGNSYASKDRRFLPIDVLYDSEEPDNQILDGLEDEVDYTNYINTGQCPLASDMQLFLNGLAQDESRNLIGNYDYGSQLYLTPDLFTDLGGNIPYSGDVHIRGVVSGNSLAIRLHNGISGSLVDANKSIITLTNNSGTSIDWNMIVQMTDMFYVDYDAGNPNIFNFQILAIVNNSGVLSEVILNGTTAVRVGECSAGGDGNDGVGEVLDDSSACDIKDNFEAAMQALLIALGPNFNPSGGSFPLNSLAVYTNGYLPEFFDIIGQNATWENNGANKVIKANGITYFTLNVNFPINISSNVSGFSIGSLGSNGHVSTIAFLLNVGIVPVVFTVPVNIYQNVTDTVNPLDFSCCNPIDTVQNCDDITCEEAVVAVLNYVNVSNALNSNSFILTNQSDFFTTCIDEFYNVGQNDVLEWSFSSNFYSLNLNGNPIIKLLTTGSLPATVTSFNSIEFAQPYLPGNSLFYGDILYTDSNGQIQTIGYIRSDFVCEAPIDDTNVASCPTEDTAAFEAIFEAKLIDLYNQILSHRRSNPSLGNSWFEIQNFNKYQAFETAMSPLKERFLYLVFGDESQWLFYDTPVLARVLSQRIYIDWSLGDYDYQLQFNLPINVLDNVGTITNIDMLPFQTGEPTVYTKLEYENTIGVDVSRDDIEIKARKRVQDGPTGGGWTLRSNFCRFFSYDPGSRLAVSKDNDFITVEARFKDKSYDNGKYKYDEIEELLEKGEAYLINSKTGAVVPKNYPKVSAEEIDCPCIPQTIAPITCQEKYQTFLDIFNPNSGIVNDFILADNYTVDDTYFCNMQFKYIVDDYSYYLQTLGINSYEDIGFISIADFGATQLNYGYNNTAPIIDAFAIVIAPYQSNTAPNDIGITPVWSDFVMQYLDDNPGICPPAMVDIIFDIDINDPNTDCEEFTANITEAYQLDAYNAYIQSLKESFIRNYVDYATTNLVENFDLEYADKEYQYTLYYYDQANNLRQTVAPEGVDRIDPSSGAQPDHDFKTEYKYNSLNQLVWQSTPDGGETRFAYDALGRVVASQNAKQKGTAGTVACNNEETIIPLSFKPSQSISVSSNGSVSSTNALGTFTTVGGISTQSMPGNGYIEFQMPRLGTVNSGVITGLTYNNNGYSNSNYGFILSNIDGGLRITEEGLISAQTYPPQPGATGYLIRIERSGTTINYYVDGVLVKSKPETNPGTPLRVNVAFKNKRNIRGLKMVKQNTGNCQGSKFSYTRHDGIDRIVETGEMTLESPRFSINDQGLLLDSNASSGFADVNATSYPNNMASGLRKEVTRTLFDEMLSGKEALFENYSGNDRNRVTGVLYFDKYNDATPLQKFHNAMFYNYDIHGSVNEMITEINNNELITMNQHIKKVQYEYDLISGNVYEIIYQKDKKDQFIHRYEYDADNRIVSVKTSSDDIIWENDAQYQYYQHGPMSRVLLGDKEVQGMDYAYTLQGLLRGVNNDVLDTKDMGADANVNNVARDAFAYSLSYFTDDYAPRIASVSNPFAISDAFYSNTPNLKNGNIRGMTTALMDVNQKPMDIAYNSYRYDQLNRISSMQNFKANSEGGAQTEGISAEFTYDRNGNLQSLMRTAFNSDGDVKEMDKLDYNYYTNAAGKPLNRLQIVKDDVNPANFDTDIDSHQYDFKYDEIGQLVQDVDEGIKEIDWRFNKKVRRISKTDGQVISYTYNGIGHRISKHNKNEKKTTYYINDGVGNVLAVYNMIDARDGNSNPSPEDYNLILESDNITTNTGITDAQNDITVAGGVNAYTIVAPNGAEEMIAGNSVIMLPGFTAQEGSDFIARIEEFGPPTDLTYTLAEQHIYGSKRLGLQQPSDGLLVTVLGRQAPTFGKILNREVGDKRYELSNHLGNVLSVITDRKLFNNDSGLGNLFTADVIAYNDYYPFGMLVPNRNGSTDTYRYGFEGNEKDDEVKGSGNQYDTQFRTYDPRLGRYFSMDPYAEALVSYSPYHHALNNPIAIIDTDGNLPKPSELLGDLGLDLPPLAAGILDGLVDNLGFMQVLSTGEMMYDMYNDPEQWESFKEGIKSLAADPIGALKEMGKEYMGMIERIANGTASDDDWYQLGYDGSGVIAGGGAKVFLKKIIKHGAKGRAAKAARKRAKKMFDCACFTAETEILTATGYKAISEVNVGESVWVFDLEENKLKLEEVSSKTEKIFNKSLVIDFYNDSVEVSEDYTFIVDGKKVQAKDLKEGDVITLINNKEVTIKQIKTLEKKTKVYEFDVTAAKKE